MTQISLTEDLKKIALQQYHPHINIDLWSLEQEEYENNHYIFKDSKFSISQDEIKLLFDESELNAQYDAVEIIVPNSFTIYKDDLNIYPEHTGESESESYKEVFSVDEIPNNLYFITTKQGFFGIMIEYYHEGDPSLLSYLVSFNISKDYGTFRLTMDDVFAGFDEELAGISIEDVTHIYMDMPNYVSYIGGAPDGIILDEDNSMQFPNDKIPDNIFLSSSADGEQEIIVNFYQKNPLHPNEAMEFLDSQSIFVEIFDDAKREEIPIIQNETVNVKIVENDIKLLLGEKEQAEYSKYIDSTNYNNIIFTPTDDLDTIIPYEHYNRVFYLKMPCFFRTISMHILTKYFDAEDNVILLNTEDIVNIVNNTPNTWIKDESKTVSRSSQKIDINGNSYGRYLIPLPDNIKSMESIEIDVFSKYTTTSHNHHQIGIIDTDDRDFDLSNTTDRYKEQISLIYNKQKPTGIDSSIQITKATRTKDNINTDDAFIFSSAANATEFMNITTPFQKDYNYESIIKYHNDNLYIEEYNPRTTTLPDRKTELQTNDIYNYITSEWPSDD